MYEFAVEENDDYQQTDQTDRHANKQGIIEKIGIPCGIVCCTDKAHAIQDRIYAVPRAAAVNQVLQRIDELRRGEIVAVDLSVDFTVFADDRGLRQVIKTLGRRCELEADR